MAWSQLDVTKPHVAYCCVGVFSLVFSLVSLYFKDRLFIGESTVAGIFGLIVGPNCLDWFNPLSWGNSDSITLEISRILLCIQVFAVSVELPRKYMLKHWLSVVMLLVPVMTSGWLIIALFVWILIPGLNFPASLLMGACITATDPVLAQSVVSGTFAQKVPGHLRNLLSCESGCNDGLAFPFVFLSLDLLIYPGKAGEIVKDWFCLTILWECIFGSFLGVVIGFLGRKTIRFAESKHMIDRESFLAFYLVLSFICAGFGSTLGVDDLLVSFFAGTAFAWDGWFATKTRESNASNVIDVVLNYAYFVYLGSIIPWADFNNSEIGLDVWRLIILSLVVIFLRRIPTVLLLKPLIPDIKSWHEAMFLGHFGPIGVGAVFASLTAKKQLEETINQEAITSAAETPFKHLQALACLWPITCFAIVTSIIMHGSSVAIIVLARHLNTVTLSATPTNPTAIDSGNSSWSKGLRPPDESGRSFSLQLLGSCHSLSGESTVRTSGAAATSSFGVRHRWKQNMERDENPNQDIEMQELKPQGQERMQPKEEALKSSITQISIDWDQEGISSSNNWNLVSRAAKKTLERAETIKIIHCLDKMVKETKDLGIDILSAFGMNEGTHYQHNISENASIGGGGRNALGSDISSLAPSEVNKMRNLREQEQLAHTAYIQGNQVIIENLHGEILESTEFHEEPSDAELGLYPVRSRSTLNNAKGSRTPFSASLESLHRISKEVDTGNYYAYKIGNDFIIEDRDRVILRHYRINFHRDKKRGYNRTSKAVIKALASVGIESKHSSVRTSRSTCTHSDDEMADDEADTNEDEEENIPDERARSIKKHVD